MWSIGGVSFENEFVYVDRDRFDEERVEFLVILVVIGKLEGWWVGVYDSIYDVVELM